MAGPRASILLVCLAGAAVGVGAIAVSSSRAAAAESDFLLSVAAGLLVLGVGLVTFNGVRVTSGLSVADVPLAASAVTAALALSLSPRPIAAPRWLGVAAAGIFTAGVLSALTSDDVVENFIPTLRFTVALALMPLVIGALTRSSRNRQLVVAAWLASAGLNALVGLTDFFGLTAVSATFLEVNSSGRVNAFTAHPNHLGIVCAMTVPVALWGTLQRRASSLPFGRVAWFAALALLVGGIFVSGSRAAVIGGLAGCAFVFLLGIRRGRAAVGLTAFFAVALLVISLLSSSVDQTESASVFERLGGNTSAQTSDAGRFDAFDEAIEGFANSPIYGEGYQFARQAHDIYLQLLQSGGVLALVAFGFFIVGSLSLGRRLRVSTRLPVADRELAGAAMASLIAWFVVGIAQPTLYDRYLYVPAGILLGLAAAERLRRR